MLASGADAIERLMTSYKVRCFFAIPLLIRKSNDHKIAVMVLKRTVLLTIYV